MKYCIDLVIKELEALDKYKNKTIKCVPLKNYPISTSKILGMKK